MNILPWKERIMATKKKSLEARGVKIAKNSSENEAMLKSASERGGIIAKQQIDGDKIDPEL